MERDEVRKILGRVRTGKMSVDEAMRRLRQAPFEDLGFAKVDLNRAMRRGFPEVVYGPGKTVEQIVAIVDRIRGAGQTVLLTRVGPEVHAAIAASHPGAEYNADARVVVLRSGRAKPPKPGVVVVTAGTSDLGVAEEAAITAETMGHGVKRVYDVGVAGIHRLVAHRESLESAGVLVVVAGMEGALPSVVAGLVDVPVIGVPTSTGYGAGSGGQAALLAMLNSCASGLAVVNIDNGFGAGYLAAQINALRPRATKK